MSFLITLKRKWIKNGSNKETSTQKNRDISKLFNDKKLETKTIETIDINLISMFKEGPEVSL